MASTCSAVQASIAARAKSRTRPRGRPCGRGGQPCATGPGLVDGGGFPVVPEREHRGHASSCPRAGRASPAACAASYSASSRSCGAHISASSSLRRATFSRRSFALMAGELGGAPRNCVRAVRELVSAAQRAGQVGWFRHGRPPFQRRIGSPLPHTSGASPSNTQRNGSARSLLGRRRVVRDRDGAPSSSAPVAARKPLPRIADHQSAAAYSYYLAT